MAIVEDTELADERIVERNGRSYRIAPCDCDNPFCTRETAYDTETGEVDIDLTIELRGKDVGIPDFDPQGEGVAVLALILDAMSGDQDALRRLRGPDTIQ